MNGKVIVVIVVLLLLLLLLDDTNTRRSVVINKVPGISLKNSSSCTHVEESSCVVACNVTLTDNIFSGKRRASSFGNDDCCK